MAKEELSSSKIFPLGEKVAEHFIGDAYLYRVFTEPTPLNARISNVTFAPGARNNWHSHTVGQVLLVTGGEGWYQEEGEPAQHLKEGDVVNIPPDVKHWHGATKNSWFVHLALSPGEISWFEAVDENWYAAL